MSISGIGLLTALIGDIASHFGCTINLKDSVTAISIVALGTSVPGNTHMKSFAGTCTTLLPHTHTHFTDTHMHTPAHHLGKQ